MIPLSPALNVFSAMFPCRPKIASGWEKKPCFPPSLMLRSSRSPRFCLENGRVFPSPKARINDRYHSLSWPLPNRRTFEIAKSTNPGCSFIAKSTNLMPDSGRFALWRRRDVRSSAAWRCKDSCFWRFECLFRFTPSTAGDNLDRQRQGIVLLAI